LNPIIDNPFAVFAIALVAQWGAAFLGDLLRRRIRPLKKDERDDFDTVLAASLTLLALIIGFSFSMAVSRYDQRKNYEAAEDIDRNLFKFIARFRDRSSGSLALLVLPVIASIAFFLIADIDSPYLGAISVVPHNLVSTSEAMKP
jgi:hypothetical protein